MLGRGGGNALLCVCVRVCVFSFQKNLNLWGRETEIASVPSPV